jgi:hypothetical protein
MPLSDSYTFLREELDKRIELLRNQICTGVPVEKYHELIGKLRGLEEARSLTLPKEVPQRDTSIKSTAR